MRRTCLCSLRGIQKNSSDTRAYTEACSSFSGRLESMCKERSQSGTAAAQVGLGTTMRCASRASKTDWRARAWWTGGAWSPLESRYRMGQGDCHPWNSSPRGYAQVAMWLRLRNWSSDISLLPKSNLDRSKQIILLTNRTQWEVTCSLTLRSTCCICDDFSLECPWSHRRRSAIPSPL